MSTFRRALPWLLAMHLLGGCAGQSLRAPTSQEVSEALAGLVRPDEAKLRKLIDQGQLTEAIGLVESKSAAFVRKGEPSPQLERLVTELNRIWEQKFAAEAQTLGFDEGDLAAPDRRVAFRKALDASQTMLNEYSAIPLFATHIIPGGARSPEADRFDELLVQRRAALRQFEKKLADRQLAASRVLELRAAADAGRFAPEDWPAIGLLLSGTQALLSNPAFVASTQDQQQELLDALDLLSQRVRAEAAVAFDAYDHFGQSSFITRFPAVLPGGFLDERAAAYRERLGAASFEQISVFLGHYTPHLSTPTAESLKALLREKWQPVDGWVLAGDCTVSTRHILLSGHDRFRWEGLCQRGRAAGKGKLTLTPDGGSEDATLEVSMTEGEPAGPLHWRRRDGRHAIRAHAANDGCSTKEPGRIEYEDGGVYEGRFSESCKPLGAGTYRWPARTGQSGSDLAEVSGEFGGEELPREGRAVLRNGDRVAVRKDGKGWRVLRNFSEDERERVAVERIRTLQEASDFGWKALHETQRFAAADAAFMRGHALVSRGERRGSEPTFVTQAHFQSMAGHAALMAGDVSTASRHWHSALLTKFKGYARLQEEYEQARRDAESRQEMLSMVGFIAGLAVDVKAARDNSRGNATWATALQNVVGPGNLIATKFSEVAQSFASMPPPPQLDSGMLSAGLPVGTVLRVPATTDAGPFGATVRVRTAVSHCTGTRVHPRIVLTNAHCIVDEDTGQLLEGPWKVVHEGMRDSTEATVVDWTTAQGRRGGWHGRTERSRNGVGDGSDWALLVIDGASSLAKWSMWRQVARSTPESVLNGSQPLMLGGYSGDLAKGHYLTLHYSCRIQRPHGKMMLSDCENAGGSSGSAVYSLDNPYVVVGLHNSGGWKFSNGDKYSSGEVRVENFIDALDEVKRSLD